MSDTTREDFEKWARDQWPGKNDWRHAEPEGYMNQQLQTAWAAWTASRQKALQEAAEAAHEALHPRNDRSDWTPYAKQMADAAHSATAAIRRLGGITSNEGERGNG